LNVTSFEVKSVYLKDEYEFYHNYTAPSQKL